VKYVVTVAERSFEVLLNGGEIVVDGKASSARLMSVPDTPLRELEYDGKSSTYAMTPDADGWLVMAGGEAHRMRVDDERTVRLGKLSGGGERGGAGGTVKAPMPGLVLRVEIKEGDTVSAGDGLVVLEAMKMENEIKAPIAGKVTAVHVAGGQAVDKGMVMVEVAAEG
jgi:pyruvate carboxylase subunit B